MRNHKKNSPMADAEYIPPPEQEFRIRKGPAKLSVRKRAKRTTRLSQLWPKIKDLALKGNSPMEIADIVNAKEKEKNYLTNAQISNLIGRKRREGEIPELSITKHGGGLRAKKGDCMLHALFLLLSLMPKQHGHAKPKKWRRGRSRLEKIRLRVLVKVKLTLSSKKCCYSTTAAHSYDSVGMQQGLTSILSARRASIGTGQPRWTTRRMIRYCSQLS